MKISLIAALGHNGELGLDNKIPWHIPEDFKHFKKITMNHCMAMGRKTFDSIGRPLPGRTTIVLTRNERFFVKDVLKAHSVDDVLKLAHEKGETELFVIGGEKIYRLFFPLCKALYLSRVDYSGEADTWFPSFNEEDWKLREKKHYKACGNIPAWTFERLDRP